MNKVSDAALRQEMLTTGKKLYQKDFIAATEGNFSMRLDENRILATPSGICKGEMNPEDLVIIDIQGNHLQGKRRASSEILLHLEAYRQRPDITAVIHAHPPYCIALMLAGKGLDRPILAENVILLGKIPIAPYARPSTQKVAESIRPYIAQTDCILLDYHGSLTAGNSLQEAFYKLEMMEHSAKSYLAALQIGEARELDRDEVKALTEMREKIYGIRWPIIPFKDF
ncbi:MAG: class II aldolase/adducin family protein [Candidatus Thorarchaeota archaeon]